MARRKIALLLFILCISACPAPMHASDSICDDKDWKCIASHCTKPNCIGQYDLIVLPQLWIAKLHHLEQLSLESAGSPKDLFPLKPEELLNYINLFPAINGECQSVKADQTSEERTAKKMQDEAVALVRSYSVYYAPIKTHGAYKKRDPQKRLDLINQVGEKTVEAMESDYLNGTNRLQSITNAIVRELRSKLLADRLKNSDTQIPTDINEIVGILPTPDDKAALKKLWAAAISKDQSFIRSLSSLDDPSVHYDKAGDLAVALSLIRVETRLRQELPKERLYQRYGGTGDLPGSLNFVHMLSDKLSNEPLLKKNYQLLLEKMVDVLMSYFVYRDAAKSTAHSSLDKYADDFQRRHLCDLVGNEAVDKLDEGWEQELGKQQPQSK